MHWSVLMIVNIKNDLLRSGHAKSKYAIAYELHTRWGACNSFCWLDRIQAVDLWIVVMISCNKYIWKPQQRTMNTT